jgi:hypothetical protein
MSENEDKIGSMPINSAQRDFINMFRVFYKRRILIISGVISFTLLSFIISIILPKTYVSEGFFQLSDPSKEQQIALFSIASELLESSKSLVFSQLKELGILDMLKDYNLEFVEQRNLFMLTIQDFKKYSSRFEDCKRFLNFIKRDKNVGKDEFEYLQNNIRNSKQLSKLIEEVYALSKEDIKDVGKILLDEKNYVVGVKLQMEANQGKTAFKFLDYITSNLNEFKMIEGKYENYILRNKFVLKQLFKKRDKLKLLHRKYPAISKVDEQLIFNLEFNAQRYLSLRTQIIGVESRIVDMEKLLECLEVESKKIDLYYKFFSELKKIVDKKFMSGFVLLSEIETLMDDYFKSKDLNDDKVKTVYNSLTTDISKFTILFSQTMRFISGPTLPEQPTRPKKSVITIIGFFISLLIFISLAFILEFWEKNKKYINKDN